MAQTRAGGLDLTRVFSSTHVLVVAALLVVQLLALIALDLDPICKCGTVKLWYPEPGGPENSQHLTDWYTITHVAHGFIFYYLLWLFAPQLPLGAKVAITVATAVGWETLENTPLLIERYRLGGLAQGYYGDSMVNSMADTVAAIGGVLLAWRLPVRVSVVLVVVSELCLAYMIRDNLMLNMAQILHPNDALTRWQKGE